MQCTRTSASNSCDFIERAIRRANRKQEAGGRSLFAVASVAGVGRSLAAAVLDTAAVCSSLAHPPPPPPPPRCRHRCRRSPPHHAPAGPRRSRCRCSSSRAAYPPHLHRRAAPHPRAQTRSQSCPSRWLSRAPRLSTQQWLHSHQRTVYDEVRVTTNAHSQL